MIKSPGHERHTLTAFDREIEQLRDLIEQMGRSAAQAVEKSLAAIASGDAAAAEQVVAEDAALDGAQVAIEKLVVTTMALRAPKADDLRLLVAALRVAAVLERIGDYAKNVARRAASVSGSGSEEAKATVAGMGRDGAKMVQLAVQAFLDEDAEAALAVAARDDRIDQAWRMLRQSLTAQMAGQEPGTSAALDLLLVGQHLERIGDHATNIADAVHAMVTGERIGQAGLSQAA